ncbi:histidine phosphatase family protein [Dictyobacter kobayashii]|uniref:Phosphoglycerate mutase n=1 Tax=Dictyobacter kobayashii TaxID=2014872 RepID=A0A402AR64_9CHLR|nr:histidine phosphatase family protein [Dictyobacter kobayashii]GCE21563.1 phosphoglycerate mutase [Dictyobacter kobayashii]
MLTLFYSPHARSVDNEIGRGSGFADVALSVAGRKLAVELGQHYAGQQLDAVFSSDLQRAAVTAAIAFGKRGLPIVLDARLREFDYGTMTQFPIAQIDEEIPRRITEPFPEGESVLMAVERVGAFLREIIREYEGKTVVIIGHRATKYGLAYWCSDIALETMVTSPWEWRDVPIWRYELRAAQLNRRVIVHAL